MQLKFCNSVPIEMSLHRDMDLFCGQIPATSTAEVLKNMTSWTGGRCILRYFRNCRYSPRSIKLCVVNLQLWLKSAGVACV